MGTNIAEMPKYRCHKEVWALKIRTVVVHDPSGTGREIDGVPVDGPMVRFAGGFIFPEDSRYGLIDFDAEYFKKHNPQPGGYYVVYEDGYKSFSPAAAFEEGYSPI